jgi:hypothetical protein
MKKILYSAALLAFVAMGAVSNAHAMYFQTITKSDVFITSATLRLVTLANFQIWHVTVTNFDMGTSGVSISQDFPIPPGGVLTISQATFSNIKPNANLQVTQSVDNFVPETQSFFTTPEPACAFQIFSCREDAVTLAYKNSPDLPANPNPVGSIYQVQATGPGFNKTLTQPWVGPATISDSNFVTFATLAPNSTYNATAIVKNRSSAWSDSEPALFTFSNNGCANSGPVITHLLPSSAVSGGSGLDMIIVGKGFDTTLAYAEFNGTRKNPISGTLSSTQMTVALSANDINLTPRQVPVDVVNPSPSTNPGISNLLYFTILPGISVTVAPAVANLTTNQTQQFTATVNGTANQAVSWSLTPNVGAISAAGVYTAPSAILSPQSITLRATSQADNTKSGTATINLTPPGSAGPIAVTVSPLSATLLASQTQLFSASVSNTTNQGVTWSLNPVGLGSISNGGLYTAPASIVSTQTVTVVATSVQDSSKSGQAIVTLTPPPSSSTQVATPVIVPNGGTFTGSVNVSMSVATSGASIHYTLDGSNPTAASPLYSNPITLSANTTVKALGVKSPMLNSAIASANFTILTPTVVPPHLNSITPNSVAEGFSSDFQMTVNGTGFDLTSVVRWNGANLVTSFDNSSRLVATVGASRVTTAGTASVTVQNSPSSGGPSDNALTFTITSGGSANMPPWIIQQPVANPNPVNGFVATQLSTLGGTFTNSGDESVLRYTWTITGPEPVSLSADGTNAAKTTLATFSKVGSYTARVRVTDSVTNFSVDSNALTITVNPGVGRIVVSPKIVALKPSEPFSFSAAVFDQFNDPFTTPVSWSTTAGAISANSGSFTAPLSGQTITVTASAGSKSDAAVVTMVIDATGGAGDLANVKVGPVPYKANSGDPGVTFRNLPTGSIIRLFTPSGRLVQTFEVPNGGNQLWDLHNANFDRVSSGVYLYRIESGDNKKEGKLVIIQ